MTPLQSSVDDELKSESVASDNSLSALGGYRGGELFHNTYYSINGFTLKNLKKQTFFKKIKKFLAINI
ncbi:hypothetical protein C2S08_07965 [Helicobacter pylori]|nr:hypothetical protein C2S08_07965 [Helicobacter pylori]